MDLTPLAVDPVDDDNQVMSQPVRSRRVRRVRIQEPVQPFLKRVWHKRKIDLLGLVLGILGALLIYVLVVWLF